MTEFDLDSPVGRRMVVAGRDALCPPGKAVCSGTASEVIAAALRVAFDDTCPTCCGRRLTEEDRGDPDALDRRVCPNPDCKDGRVPPAFVETAEVGRLIAKAQADTREQIVEFLRSVPFGSRLILTSEMADRIERHERER